MGLFYWQLQNILIFLRSLTYTKIQIMYFTTDIIQVIENIKNRFLKLEFQCVNFVAL